MTTNRNKTWKWLAGVVVFGGISLYTLADVRKNGTPFFRPPVSVAGTFYASGDSIPGKKDAKTQGASSSSRRVDGNLEKELEAVEKELARARSGFYKEEAARARDGMKKAVEEMAKARVELEKAAQELRARYEAQEKDRDALVQVNWPKVEEQMKKANEELERTYSKMNSGEMEKQMQEMEKQMEKMEEHMVKAREDLLNLRSFLTELEKEGLLDRSKPYRIEFRKGVMYINGELAPERIQEKFRNNPKYKKYFDKDSNYYFNFTEDSRDDSRI